MTFVISLAVNVKRKLAGKTYKRGCSFSPLWMPLTGTREPHGWLWRTATGTGYWFVDSYAGRSTAHGAMYECDSNNNQKSHMTS